MKSVFELIFKREFIWIFILAFEIIHPHSAFSQSSSTLGVGKFAYGYRQTGQGYSNFQWDKLTHVIEASFQLDDDSADGTINDLTQTDPTHTGFISTARQYGVIPIMDVFCVSGVAQNTIHGALQDALTCPRCLHHLLSHTIDRVC